MSTAKGMFFTLGGQKNYEIHLRGGTVTLPEGSGGETPPGPATVDFGETNHSHWPDSFETIGIIAFSSDLVKAFKIHSITGADWYPIIIAKNHNRRLLKKQPPRYLWPRINGRIRATPYYSKYITTDQRDTDGNEIQTEVRTDERVELDKYGCLIINRPTQRYLSHQINPETWDGTDLMRVLPIVAPYELCSRKFANLLASLKVQNMKAFPLGKGYGL